MCLLRVNALTVWQVLRVGKAAPLGHGARRIFQDEFPPVTPDQTPSAAVIIPHYQDHVRLERCLAALMQNDLEGIEVVVVDNGSPDPLDGVMALYPQVRFVTEPSKGAAAARNRGVAETAAPAIFFLDADCVPAPDWTVQARCAVRPGTLTGGRIDVFDEGDPPRSGAQVFENVFAFQQRDYIERKGFSVTANLVTTREVFEVTGPMITGVSEDLEWCRRAVSKGFELRYDDALVVGHPSRSDWPALRKKWIRMIDEEFELCRGTLKGRLRWTARALAMPVSAAVHTPRIWTHPAPRDMGERLRGTGALWRQRLMRAGQMLRRSIRP